jgi:hypothetical protein
MMKRERAASFNAATDATRGSGRWLIFVIHSITPTSTVWYNPVDVGEVTGAMRYAKSLSDVWTDTISNVGAYWRGQKIVTDAIAQGGTTYSWTLPPHFPPGKVVRVTVSGGTPTQHGRALAWSEHGYYEVALDAGSLTLSP